jgi:Lrp/AsnC family leucine-responsive transcriptional regulator
MLDDISIQILRILQEKARVPNSEVARRVNMAPSGVLERVRKLEKQGIIDGYEVRLNPERFGRSLVGFILVAAAEGADEAKLGRSLAAVPDALEVHFVAGEDSFLVKLRARDPEALERIRRDKITRLPGVSRTRTLIVLSTFKETARIPLDDSALQNLKQRRR